MTKARIVQKSKNAMQSGRYGTDEWELEYLATDPQRPDPLMGWAGSGDTKRQLKLKFVTLDSARAYAELNGISYVVVPAAPRVLKIQTYADNFR
jgi:ETC complex I subunit conserved region